MTEPSPKPRIPPLDLLLGYGPAALLPLLGLAAWVLAVPQAEVPVALAQLWAAAILVFLAGVRRGLSFVTPGGARPIQIVTMIWLFGLGLIGLALRPPIAFPALVIGYGSVALLDPRAARRGEVPAYFARLRPPQMALALAGLIALTVRVYTA